MNRAVSNLAFWPSRAQGALEFRKKAALSNKYVWSLSYIMIGIK
jgi:hypothetical protein